MGWVVGDVSTPQQLPRALEAIPLVKGENVHQGYIDWKIAKRWPSAQLNGCEKYLLEPKDVVLKLAPKSAVPDFAWMLFPPTTTRAR